MSNMVQLSSIIKDYKANFGKELRKIDERQANRVIVFLNRIRIRDSAIFLHEKGAEFINIGINDAGDKFEVIQQYYFHFMKKKYWFIITEVDKKANEIDSIEIIYPSAKNYENEINKRFGLKFISFTEEVSASLFELPVPLEAEERELNILPIGIYNKIHDNNFYFHLQVENDKIKSVTEKSG